MLNYQDIKKPAYYAYKYLNQLGDTELSNTDSSAIICKDVKGNIQALFWDFTIDHPGDTVNNQVFYKRDLTSKNTPTLNLKLTGLKPGRYNLTTYKTGYGANDTYLSYLKMGSPAQLTKEQVRLIKEQNSGKPLQIKTITIGKSGKLDQEFSMRQNDVFLVTIDKI